MNTSIPTDVSDIRKYDTAPAWMPVEEGDQRAVAATSEFAAFERAAAPMHWIEQRAHHATTNTPAPYEFPHRAADGLTEKPEIVRRFLSHVYHVHPLVEPYPLEPEE